MIDPVLADEQLEKEAERRADMIERRKWEKELSDAKWSLTKGSFDSQTKTRSASSFRFVHFASDSSFSHFLRSIMS
jgi:hypothetical protein